MPASEVTESATPSLPADDFKAIFRGRPNIAGVITENVDECPVALTASSIALVVNRLDRPRQ